MGNNIASSHYHGTKNHEIKGIPNLTFASNAMSVEEKANELERIVNNFNRYFWIMKMHLLCKNPYHI